MPFAPWLFPLLLPLGLWVPGWLLGRALHTPAGPAGALLGSAAVLTNVVLALNALNLPLNAVHLTASLIVVCGLLAGIAIVRPPRAPADAVAVAVERRDAFLWSPSHSLWLAAAAGLGAIVWRAALEPLSGFDNFFRWDFLAREMLRVGHLHFYPAVAAGDFLHYPWCDGIAPLISSLYLWSYCSVGQTAAWATAPIVAAQGVVVFWLVGQLATRHGGVAAGRAAMAVLATNAWFLWAVAMGQETGFTALGLVGMFYFLDRARTEPTARWPIWAGITAGTGALAREYGLAFAALGLATILWQRMPRRAILDFSIAACAVTAPWYLRNWALTGNPLWSQSLGGLFPANPVHLDYHRALAAFSSVFQHPDRLPLAVMVLAIAAVPLALGVAGLLSLRRTLVPWLVAIVTVVGLWLWSIGQTSGGLSYSLRVLAPAFALGAVFAGIGLGRWAASARAPWLAIALAVLAADAGARSLHLPVFPMVAWWRSDASPWLDFGRGLARWHADPNWQQIAEAAEGRKILVSDPSCFRLLLDRGAKPVAFFSPEVGFLFGSGPDIDARIAQLRELGYRFIVMNRDNPVVDALAQQHPFFGALKSTRPAGTTSLSVIYDLYSPLREK